VYERDRGRLLRKADALAPWATDAAIALIALPPTVVILGHGHNAEAHGGTAKVVLAAVVSVLPLLVRRRWPLQVLAFILVLDVAVPGPAAFLPAALVALYTIASRRPWRVALVAAVVTAIAFALHPLVWGYSLPLSAVIAELALVAFALALGLYQATRLVYVGQLRERAARLERERELLAQQGAAEERLRIARELHDVVAHNVSLMVVQAQALGATAHDAQQTCRGADAIADLGRTAMNEMHRTLELMRPDSAETERSPQPTLSDLGALLQKARTAGISAELSVTGEPRPLASGVELSAYRIVQEALTNVLKHAGAAHTEVSVRYCDRGLELEIVDDGRGASEPEVARSGHGLIGMRERVALFGGTLSAGPLNGRGYRVEALLPYSTQS
jgi:signal transduction histidine kinase